MNIYGETESRSSNVEIKERWERILAEIAKIEMKGEVVIVIGDLNKQVGDIIEGNTMKMSFGGSLIRDMLDTGSYILVNATSKVVGGPFTRFDPANPDRKSCLDLVIMSKELFRYVHKLFIDKHLVFTPGRPVSKSKIRYTDHRSLILEFRKLPLKLEVNTAGARYALWNTNKIGGWEVYKMLTENNKNIEDAVTKNDDPTVAMKAFDKELNKVKFKSFGRVKYRNGVKTNKELQELQIRKNDCILNSEGKDDEELESIEKKIAENLLSEQRKNLEKELKLMNELKSKKGKSASIFAIKDKVIGKKKMEQEATIIKNPVDNIAVTEPEQIRQISLKYCTDLLTNRQPRGNFLEDIQWKKEIHELRMQEQYDDDIQFSRELFEKSLKALKQKSPKYDFILRSGNSLKEALYHLFENVWTNEHEPTQWRNTNIIQIYKGKGSKDDLGNQRNIHTKLDVPKFFGHIVIGAAKGKIIQNMSKYQLGTKPGHRAQEHLFVMRSIISLYSQGGKALIIQLYDISKSFDREMLRDCMDSLYNSGIRGKLYRLIFEMNRETRIKVRTAVGVSSEESTGEGVGQGTLDGAILSACSIDYSMGQFFSKSSYEISYGGLNLQPLLYQDDIFRMCSDPFRAQIGNELIDSVMETKLLDFNLDKSCYLVIGNKEAQMDIKEKFRVNPLKLSGKCMKEAIEEKYLGDYISEEGLGKSTISTIKKRYNKVMNTLTEIRAVIEDTRAQTIGGIVTGLEIWEVAVMPYLLNNGETWCNIPNEAISMLDNVQNEFLRKLMSTPMTCPTPSLMWETGTTTMSNRILKKKLNFFHHILHLDRDSLAWQVGEVQLKLGLPGLLQECTLWIKELALPDALKCSKLQWKKLVDKKIKEKNKDDLLDMIKEKDYKKLDLEQLKTEVFCRKEYMTKLSLQAARTKFSIRTKMVKTVKLNYKNDPTNKISLWKCDDCSSVDSQEHILWCPAYSAFRIDKDLDSDRDLTKYFQQVLRFRDS